MALAEVLSALDQDLWLYFEAPVWPDWCSTSGHFSNLHSGSVELSQHHVLTLNSSSFDLSRLHNSRRFFLSCIFSFR